MSSKEVEEAQTAATEKRDGLIREAASQVEAMVKIVTEALPELWAQDLKHTRDTHPDQMLELGSDGVAKVKESLAELQSRASEVAKSELGPEVSAWPHSQTASKRADEAWKYRQVKGVWPEDQWRRARGAIGLIYKEFNLVADYHVDAWARGGWHRYPFALDPPAELEGVLETYRSTIVRLVDADERVADLTAELKKTKAQELWDGDN